MTAQTPRLPEILRRTIKAFIHINDSPHRIAAGLGVGVFTGIFPGTGPLAALFLASLLRLNRAAALAGSLATNTWLSIVTFVLSIKVGSAIMGLEWHAVYERITSCIAAFRWTDLFKVSFLQLVVPLLIGYVSIALLLCLGTYVCVLACIVAVQLLRRSRAARSESHGCKEDPHH